jgi:hypothetical protein
MLMSPHPLPSAVVDCLVELIPAAPEPRDSWLTELLVRPELDSSRAATLFELCGRESASTPWPMPARHRYWARAEHSVTAVLAGVDRSDNPYSLTQDLSGRDRVARLVEVLADRWCVVRAQHGQELLTVGGTEEALAVALCEPMPENLRVAALARVNDLAWAARARTARTARLPKARTDLVRGLLTKAWGANTELADRLTATLTHLPDTLTHIVPHLPPTASAACQQTVVDAFAALLQRPRITYEVRWALRSLVGEDNGRRYPTDSLSRRLTEPQRATLHAAACSVPGRAALLGGPSQLSLELLFAPESDQLVDRVGGSSDVAAWMLSTPDWVDVDWAVLLRMSETFSGTAAELLTCAGGVCQDRVAA